LGEAVENLIQYATSGVAVPIQRAAIAALDEGEGFLETQLQRFSESRTVLCDGLSAIKRLSFERPKGAFYLFCKVDGVEDTKALAFRWIDEAGVGVAPGAAFGAAFGSYVRLCFARDPAAMAETVSRLQDWFATSE
jgi:aspartate/methionine/tyrosine aminotransferase